MEFWYDDPLQELPDELQLCPDAAGAELVTKVYDPPWGRIAALPVDDGVIAINIGRAGEDYRIVEAMLATLLQVFPSAHVIEVPNSFNAVVVATVQPSEVGNLWANLPGLEGDEFLYSTALQALANLRPTQPGEIVFTDDRAAIELMTNALVVNFVLRGSW